MKKVFIFIIRIYQVTPIHTHNKCRFSPTCSQYMIDAINKYGSIKGIKLGLKRLKKCRPGGGFGYDPVK